VTKRCKGDAGLSWSDTMFLFLHPSSDADIIARSDFTRSVDLMNEARTGL
jgi:hypothetical protein